MEEPYEIKKVLLRKDGVKYIIIPQKSLLTPGDYVIIKRVKEINI